MNHFDSEAAKWDKNPEILQRSMRIAEQIRAKIPLDKHFRVLDYGCGTGELLLALQPYVSWLLGVDTSAGMVKRFLEKMKEAGLENISAQVLDFGEIPHGEFELVICSMVLHHIPDPILYLRELERLITPGGYLVIVDLAKENGSFHPKGMSGVFHEGFESEEIRAWLEYCYLEERLHDPRFYTIAKNAQEYPITFTIAQKSA
ncbi:MAG: class I SAM-dependent methyltransferase [Wolinella sp.]